MRDLSGKNVVVTGAASGIGRAMAERFAREGMRVVLADVEEKPLAEARDAVAALGAEAIAVRTDVSNSWQVEALARRALEAFGAVHVLCNNAGVVAGGPVWEIPQADWDWVVGVNLFGVVHGVRAFVPRMIEQGEGHVVNTASIAGIVSTPMAAPYCATKHAVVALSECLHHDLAATTGGKVKASVLCPGWVKTNIADAGRNRPPAHARPKGEAGARQEGAGAIDGFLRTAVASGIDPADVAAHVVTAIVEERFWVLTHPKMKKAVERRTREILDDVVPAFDWTRI